MELEERVPLEKVRWLATLSFKRFEQECINKKTKKEDICLSFEQLRQFCKVNIRNGGITRRYYSYSANAVKFYEGRLYSGGSIQGIPATVRGFLMKGTTTDIDMSNSFASIIRFICKKYNISAPHLEYYINNREDCLSRFPSRLEGKEAYIVAAYSDKILRNKIDLKIMF